ncbi:MAG: hypothetical protein L0241_18720 [Planctomycetia bacterium]|nr:hypothetical protein [Planctomycetia bacterium]
MPRVRLYLAPPDGGVVFRFRRPGGMPDHIDGLRLVAYVNLSPLIQPGPTATHAAFPTCVIDTGAYLTVIPERVWGQFKPGAFTSLPFDSAMSQQQRVVAHAGGTFAYELAEFPLRLEDRQGGAIDLLVIAQLIHDRGTLTTPLVLGLRGEVLDGRILRAEPDATVPYGQVWLLEDP